MATPVDPVDDARRLEASDLLIAMADKITAAEAVILLLRDALNDMMAAHLSPDPHAPERCLTCRVAIHALAKANAVLK